MYGFDNQMFMVFAAGAFMGEDTHQTLRNLYGSIHRQRNLPRLNFFDGWHVVGGKIRELLHVLRTRLQVRKPAHAASKPANLELSRAVDQADSACYRYQQTFGRRRFGRRSQGQDQLRLPLATTWVGYRPRPALAQALQQAEARLDALCPHPQAYAMSWSELQCIPRA